MTAAVADLAAEVERLRVQVAVAERERDQVALLETFAEHGAVTLSVQHELGDGDNLTFAVTDTGIGMSEEQAGRLLTAFTQAKTGTSVRYGGTGLGLALSREFCRLLGGDITVESEPGVGWTFTIRLPALATAEVRA